MSGTPDDWIDEACGEYGTSIDPDTKPHTAMGNAIRAFLAAAEADRVVLTHVPGYAHVGGRDWLRGYNAAIASIQAGKVAV